jgi:DNA-binding LytR/AlgR family response regulator
LAPFIRSSRLSSDPSNPAAAGAVSCRQEAPIMMMMWMKRLREAGAVLVVAALVFSPAMMVVDYTLTELEERLDPRRFVRIHRATIVNAALVHELFPAIDGGMLVRLKDEANMELPVARDRVRDLKERLGI